ncbi:SAV_6107 family HEPN domain-containing protein [bacterium]
MTLKILLNQGRLIPHSTSKDEVISLLELIKRDIKDSKVEAISEDRRLATAYNAALQTATVLLYCVGYKTKGVGHHSTVFQAMKEIMGKEYIDLADYFDSCRNKRNIIDYTHAWGVSETEVEELIEETEKFVKLVTKWIKTNYSKYIL